MPYNPDTETWSRPVPSMTQLFETMEEAVAALRNSGYDQFVSGLSDGYKVWRHRDKWSAFLNVDIDGEVYVTYIRD